MIVFGIAKDAIKGAVKIIDSLGKEKNDRNILFRLICD